MMNFIYECGDFFKENWKDTLPYIFTVFGIIWGGLKYNLPQKKFIRDLELAEKYLSKDSFNKLKQEPAIIKDMTIRIFPSFRGVTFTEVDKLLKIDIGDNNFFTFLDLYKKKWIDDSLNLTDDGKKLLNRKWDWDLHLWYGAFFIWCIGLAITMSFIFSIKDPLGIILSILLVCIPEISLLNYADKRNRLRNFKSKNISNTTRRKKCQ
ncbi:hypothetical protein [Rodentibacter myodis]|uniref:Uncharacterized protein n=1 Tax=Rodentibacter myodis TaxID=1907939 RepID=A0A1V3JPK6_9PAST|nr:hypothetical protein [Rodentibacter myodis]OOF58575.1 hypothetical protein BKL49_06610 [Rodentibacter myodis]